MTEVHVEHIYWKDEDDQDITEPTRIKLGLPYEETLELDDTTGDWSENGLEEQCIKFLDEKYVNTGMTVSYLTVDYP